MDDGIGPQHCEMWQLYSSVVEHMAKSSNPCAMEWYGMVVVEILYPSLGIAIRRMILL